MFKLQDEKEELDSDMKLLQEQHCVVCHMTADLEIVYLLQCALLLVNAECGKKQPTCSRYT